MAEFLNNNIKHLRNKKNISQQTLADKIGIDRSTISRIENGEIETTVDNAIKIADILNVSLVDLISKDLRIDNAELIDLPNEVVKIPVLGIIKAGMPIEAQENIIDYINIPKDWVKSGKQFFGLKISGDSMFPKYNTNDVVIFEKNDNGFEGVNKKDCCVMVNGFDATFKNITILDNGITLVPLNLNNSDNFQPTFYNAEQILNLPVKVIGIAREIRRNI